MSRALATLASLTLAVVLASVGLALVLSARLRGDLDEQYLMFGGSSFGTSFFVLVGIVQLVVAVDLLVPRWRRVGALIAGLLMSLALVFTLVLPTSPKPVSNLLSLRLLTPELTAAADAEYQACLSAGAAATCEEPAGDAASTRLLVWIRDVIAYRPPDAIGYRVLNESVLNVGLVVLAGLVWQATPSRRGRQDATPERGDPDTT